MFKVNRKKPNIFLKLNLKQMFSKFNLKKPKTYKNLTSKNFSKI